MSLSLPYYHTGGSVGTYVAEVSLDVATYLTIAAEGSYGQAACFACASKQDGSALEDSMCCRIVSHPSFPNMLYHIVNLWYLCT